MGVANIGSVIEPKSDQLNSDDLAIGPRTIKITGTSIYQEAGKNKISISFEGDNGKPWKPCTTTARLMAILWKIPGDDDGSGLVGHSLTIYRDPSVKWSGMAVGGIRISHMDTIDKDRVEMVTIARGKKEAMIIKPLKLAATVTPITPKADKAKEGSDALIAMIENCMTGDELADLLADADVKKKMDYLESKRPELAKEVNARLEIARKVFGGES